MRRIVVAISCLVCSAVAVADVGASFDRSEALAISQAAIGTPIGDHVFRSVNNQDLRLADFRGKPLVISLIYTSCYHICPATTAHLAKVVQKARNALGEDSFHVLTLGFDAANDTPERMRVFAAEQGVDFQGWDVLSGDSSAIEALAGELGFQYYPTPNGFDHLIQASIVDAEGVVYRQVYGIQFDTPHLIEPLKVLVFGGKGEGVETSLLDEITARVKLFCTVYDPASDSYRFDYSIFVGLIMGLVMGAVFLYLLYREWVTSRKA
ncbi:MAG: SCO family protein, partial [Candidatus Latescibacterota bacterium]|nr:SCO family protein [Candidatus Latescibacterota bacterium]